MVWQEKKQCWKVGWGPVGTQGTLLRLPLFASTFSTYEGERRLRSHPTFQPALQQTPHSKPLTCAWLWLGLMKGSLKVGGEAGGVCWRVWGRRFEAQLEGAE